MPIFIWKAKTRNGASKKGEMDAVSEAVVLTQLRVQMLLPVMYADQPYTVVSRAVHIHPTVSELLPTMLQDLRPLE